MSLPEAPVLTRAEDDTIPSLREPEIIGPPAVPLSDSQRLKAMSSELRRVCMELDKTRVRLNYYQICHQSEAQSRQTFQRGLEAHQRVNSRLMDDYKSIYEEYEDEKSILQEDLQLSEKLVASQNQLIELYKFQQQQQHLLPASHVIQGGPLLPQYGEQNHSCQYSPESACSCQAPCSQYVMDPADLRQFDNFDYSTGFSTESSYDTGPVIPTPAADMQNRSSHLMQTQMRVEHANETEPLLSTSDAEAENQTHRLSAQSIVHPQSAERDIPELIYADSNATKRRPEDGGAKPNKRRKMK